MLRERPPPHVTLELLTADLYLMLRCTAVQVHLHGQHSAAPVPQYLVRKHTLGKL